MRAATGMGRRPGAGRQQRCSMMLRDSHRFADTLHAGGCYTSSGTGGGPEGQGRVAHRVSGEGRLQGGQLQGVPMASKPVDLVISVSKTELIV